MWIADWYRSARFLPPAGSTEAIDALLRGEHGRVLVLWAPGGMGKTEPPALADRAPLRARRRRLRADRLRRDRPADRDARARLLLLEAAAQLDRQLPDAPFHELLAAYAGQRERLYGAPRPRPRAADELAERFAGVLRDLPAGRRVVLVLDTLEKALLLGGRKRASRPVLAALLESARERRPAPRRLRLVLAWRYPLSERVREFAELFPGAAELRSRRSAPTEARRYLKRYRGIARPEVVERLVRRADGIPFKLELLADVAEEHPDLDPRDAGGPAADVGCAT